MSADEMFKKLGYQKEEWDDENRIYYFQNDYSEGTTHPIRYIIEFDKELKLVHSYVYEDDYSVGIGMNELRAINKKVEELGWLTDNQSEKVRNY